MAVSDAHKRASRKWDSARDSITIRPTKEEGSAIRQAAAAANVSLQKYILSALSEYMNKAKK